MNNRIMKFRAWDSKNKKFPFTEFHIIGETNAFDLLNQYKLEEFCELEITQFTGAKDKNEKDIYEGDIIRGEEVYYCVKDSVMKSLGECVGHIWYSDRPEWVVSFNHLYSESSTGLINISKIEVIGNIFENENLLGEHPRR